jgi:hypothetical protein
MRRARGEGRLFRPSYTDKASGQHKRAGVWWIQYHDPRRPVGQQKLRESSGSTKKGEAVKLLQKRLAEVRAGRPTGPDVDKVTVGELFQMLRDDYRLNERRSLGRLQECLAHLTTYFGENTKALAVAEDRIAAYTLTRKDEGAANATINRELSAVKRAFRLGERAQKVARRPLVDHRVRQGRTRPRGSGEGPRRREGPGRPEGQAHPQDRSSSAPRLPPQRRTQPVPGWCT